MFPLQQSDELLFQIISNDNLKYQQGKISQDYASLESSHHDLLNIKSASKKIRKLPRKVLLGKNNNFDKRDEITENLELKKIIHRDIERQRRQGMATLYSSLRSLLPLQYVKGKRSVSDHMHEAVNYIKQLQSNMNELERRRDKLKMINSSHQVENGSSGSSSVSTDHCVTVSPCHGGIEILINYKGESNLPLSRLLNELMKEGVDVVSCVSSKVNQNSSLHRIQSETCDMKCMNLHAFQRKLIDAING